MINRITGRVRLCSDELQGISTAICEKTRNHRFVHVLEMLVIYSCEMVMRDAGQKVPSCSNSLGLYLGIDRSIEDIKDEFLKNVLEEGLLGASPSLFPFTTPNALAAQAAIVLDIRGESIMFYGEDCINDVTDYADACISQGRMNSAITGFISRGRRGNYCSDLCFLEGRNLHVPSAKP